VRFLCWWRGHVPALGRFYRARGLRFEVYECAWCHRHLYVEMVEERDTTKVPW
jgi:hypothetical protein